MPKALSKQTITDKRAQFVYETQLLYRKIFIDPSIPVIPFQMQSRGVMEQYTRRAKKLIDKSIPDGLDFTSVLNLTQEIVDGNEEKEEQKEKTQKPIGRLSSKSND